MLLSVSATDFLEVDSNAEINLAKQKQHDKTISTKQKAEIYRVRGRKISESVASENSIASKDYNNGVQENLMSTTSKNLSRLMRGPPLNAVRLPENDISDDKTQSTPKKDVSDDIDQSPQRNRQREWVKQKDLSKSEDRSGKAPSNHSNDLPSLKPTLKPTAMKPTAFPTRTRGTLPPTRPKPQPTPAPQRPSVTLPPFSLPPIRTPTRLPTRRPTSEKPSRNPTKGPTASEPGPPTPVQEPGGGEIDPPEPGGGGIIVPPGGGGGIEPPEPGGGGGIDPPEPGGGGITEPFPPTRLSTTAPTSEPTSDPSQSPSIPPTKLPTSLPTVSTPSPGEPGGGQPGGGGNQPEPGEPGGGGNEPGTGEPDGGGNQPGPGSGSPGGGGDEPGGEPGGGGNEPGGEIVRTSPPTATAAPTIFTQIPTVIEDAPGEPSGGGNQPGEPNGGQPGGGDQPGGGNNEPGEPGGGGSQPGGSEPGEPVNLLGDKGDDDYSDSLEIPIPTPQPIKMTIAALNAADGHFKPEPTQIDGFEPEPIPNGAKVYSPGSPEWNKERISVAEVPPFELHFVVLAKTKDLEASVEDTNVLEALTAEYILNYSKLMIGSNLLAIDNLMLQSIEIKGSITKPSRRILESRRVKSLTKRFKSADTLQQPYVFTFQAKFVFMHWTKIAWALNLPGLAENLVKTSLAEDKKEDYLTTLQEISSNNNTIGMIEDFLFSSATDVYLAKIPQILPEVDYEIQQAKEIPPFFKPEFPILSILAFSSLGLAIALCLVRCRIETKKQKWLKKSAETYGMSRHDEEYEISRNDDEVTVIFSDSSEDGDTEEYCAKKLQKNTLDDNLKWAHDKGICGDEEDQIWVKTSGKTATTAGMDEEVTVICSGSSENDDSEYSYNRIERSVASGLSENLQWALDYLIYCSEDEEKQKNGGGENSNKNDDEDDTGSNTNPSKEPDGSSVAEAYESFTARHRELGKSTHHASNLSLQTSKRELGKTTHHASNLTLNTSKQGLEKSQRHHAPNLPTLQTSKQEIGKSTHHASNLTQKISKRQLGKSKHHVSKLHTFHTPSKRIVNRGKKTFNGYQSFTKRNRELEKDSKHVLNLTFQRRRNAIKGSGLGDEYEGLISRRGGMEAVRENASNLELNTSKGNTKQ